MLKKICILNISFQNIGRWKNIQERKHSNTWLWKKHIDYVYLFSVNMNNSHPAIVALPTLSQIYIDFSFFRFVVGQSPSPNLPPCHMSMRLLNSGSQHVNETCPIQRWCSHLEASIEFGGFSWIFQLATFD